MSLVKPDLSEITFPPIFCGCFRERNTHLERLDDTTDRYDISWKVANTSNCILILYNVGSQKKVSTFSRFNWICQIFRHNFSLASCKAPRISRIVNSQKEQTFNFYFEEPRQSWFP